MSFKLAVKKVVALELDDAALDTLSPTQAFVFGAEWGLAYQRVQSPAATRLWVHTSNTDRIIQLLTVMNRSFALGEVSDGLVELMVSGLD
jgi:hypothetical protein